tara:strand:- start:337 stop:849 length:513 start_codon:yes stop_codon:yes gene_type:complete
MKKEKNFLKMSKKLWIDYKILAAVTFNFLFFFNICNADIIKPSKNIDPREVVLIQLNALMENDRPYKDKGIEQTWEFAHPNNQRVTGPLDRFKRMLKGASYSMLINHKENTVTEIYRSNEMATYEVVVLDKDKQYFKFKWQVEKTNIEGNLLDCWLTTAVSQPIPLGSSI